MPSQDEIPDAPVYEPAPLILFAHGFDISSDRYASLLHDLAADGFVVAAPEFPMSSTVFGGAPDEYDVPDQARDLSFLIAAMTGPDAPVSLAEMIAPGPVGVIGHSDGAVTALLAAYAPRYADSRIGAVVAVSGDFDTFGGEWFTTNDPPLLAIHGEYDEINPFESSQLLVGNDPGPAMLVGVQGQSHLGSVTDSQVVPAVARLIAFNFRWRLNGLPDAQAATIETASTSPLEFVASHD
jgi:predicted dienelactone hydrolase